MPIHTIVPLAERFAMFPNAYQYRHSRTELKAGNSIGVSFMRSLHGYLMKSFAVCYLLFHQVCPTFGKFINGFPIGFLIVVLTFLPQHLVFDLHGSLLLHSMPLIAFFGAEIIVATRIHHELFGV